MTPLHSFSFTLGLKFMSEKKKDIFYIFFFSADYASCYHQIKIDEVISRHVHVLLASM